MEDYDLEELRDFLTGKGYTVHRGTRYLISQCVKHGERNPSMQIYPDGWCLCHAGDGRFHIATVFPELRKGHERPYKPSQSSRQMSYQNQGQRPAQKTSATNYRTFDLYDEWSRMEPIPRDHIFKGIPLTILDHMGWRYDRGDYFIPYFNERRDAIPFGQWRHLSGERRFTFLKDAKPTVYGKWNLKPGGTYFVVEGASDCAVLEYAGIPWVGMPSASSGELMKKLADWALANDVNIRYAGDNDMAGDKLREALDEVMNYRVKQPPSEFKDWGEFLGGRGRDAVREYCRPELPIEPSTHTKPINWDRLSNIEKIQAMWPGAEELKLL